ncbi:MAG TPA: hypothetical protein VMM81_08960 [Acidimicrobiia bacterium]|nr:hypothetical protein [Acidimicrobiia bacterium]
MYELAGWGNPAPPDWVERKERIEARLPADLVRQLRARARSEGIAVTDLLERIVRDAVDPVSLIAAISGDVADF